MRIKRRGLCAVLLLGLLIMLLGGCARKEQPLPAGMDGTQVIADAIAVAEELCSGQTQRVYERLRADVAESVTVDDVAALAPSLGDWIGVTGSHAAGQTDKKTGETYAMATLTCKFEEGKRLIYVGFDTQGTLIGLRVSKAE